jgi:FKBP12-rapamycin complex-associated protein
LARSLRRPAGRLAKANTSHFAGEFVEFEVKRSFEWLAYEHRRFVAVTVLKELAHSVPTLFLLHVATFFDQVCCLTFLWLAEISMKTDIDAHTICIYGEKGLSHEPKIWVAIRDPKDYVREAAAEALGACLQVIAFNLTVERLLITLRVG